MKVKLLVLALVMLGMASLGFAQGLVFYQEGAGGTFYLTKKCGGTGGAIPIGTKVWMMNDTDGDGWVSCTSPDPDPTGVLCNFPNDCETGPAGTVNRLWFPMGEGTGTAGTFATDPALMGSGGAATFPRFYLKIVYCETTAVESIRSVHKITYLSEVATMPAYDLTDVDLASSSHWTCCEWDTSWTQPCTPDIFTVFGPILYPQGGHMNFHDCATVCPPQPHTVSIGPCFFMPHGFVLPGCSPTNTPCDSLCEPANGWSFGPLVFVRRPPDSAYWYATIVPLTGATGGCVCILVDWGCWLAVEMGQVAIVPLSEAVRIQWRTMSETDMDRFDIYRDGIRIAFKLATNSPSGASYEYLDEPVENGRTYTYELRSVDVNGEETVHATQSVTPSAENAVVIEYALYQNYPNPFNPSTKIAFDLVDNNPVTLTVYNTTGQVVATPIDGVNYTKGRHSITFEASNFTSGLYFCAVKIGSEFTATKKMLLVK
jgi:hypothetical protein